MAISPSSLEPPEYLPTTLGRYTLQRIIGRGAAGVVYLATLNGPAGFRKRVALKLVISGATTEVVSEARLGALLDHPNIVGIYDLSREGPWWLIAMEWVPGPTLLEVLQARGVLPGLALQQLVGQVAEALFHAHGLVVDGRPHPIVHRDLKPSNVLITPGGRVKVADLGLATLGGTTPDVPIGTPGYMAPEQLVQGGRVDARADQFALGILIAELALGRRMVRGRSIEDVRARHRRIGEEIAKGSLQRALDGHLPGLGDLVARCLSPLPDDRFADCGDLRDAIAALAAEGEGLADCLSESSGGAPDPDDATALAIGPSNITVVDEDAVLGRSDDLLRLAEAVQSAALVIVHGPGGMGKSTVVRRYGATLARQFAGGAWLCDAHAASDPEALCSAVADALGTPLGDGATSDVIQQVGHQLRVRGDLVLILDDVDNAVDAAREVLGRWLAIAEEARFVVTSRHRLRMDGEVVVELGPLADTAAIDLLRDRAGRAGPAAAAWTQPGNEAVLTELARRLDGVPLALELAAARARLLTPEQLLVRLDDRLRVLGDSNGRSLAGVLEESWEQLPDRERRVLAQLSVFRDGFDVEDAEGVVDPGDGAWVMDSVGALLDRALVTARPRGHHEPRFFLYETIRLFAEQKLGRDSAVALRHARWFARLGRPEHLLRSPDDPRNDDLARELSNLEAGCETAIAAGDGATAAGCAIAAGHAYKVRGPLQRGLTVIRRALTVASDHARLCAAAARLGLSAGTADADRWAERALALARDPRDRTEALHVLGSLQARAGAFAEARSTLERALREARQLGAPVMEGEVALTLGRLLGTLEHSDARGMLGYALRLGRRSEDPALQTTALIALGRRCRKEDDLESAQRWLHQALELGKALPERTAHAHRTLGTVERMLGNLENAHRNYLAALSVYRRLGQRTDEATVLGDFAVVAGMTGDLVEARDRLATGERLLLDMGDRVAAAVMTLNRGAMSERIGDLAEAGEAFRTARAVTADLGLVVSTSNADVHLTLLDLETGHPDRALARATDNLRAISELERGAGAQRIALLTMMAQALLELGRTDEAVARAEEAARAPSDEPTMRAMSALELGIARLSTLGEASEELQRALELAHASRDRWVLAFVELRIAELALPERDPDRLSRHAAAVLDRGIEPMRGLELHARGLLALAAVWTGRGPARTVLDLADALDRRGFRARASRMGRALEAPENPPTGSRG